MKLDNYPGVAWRSRSDNGGADNGRGDGASIMPARRLGAGEHVTCASAANIVRLCGGMRAGSRPRDGDATLSACAAENRQSAWLGARRYRIIEKASVMSGAAGALIQKRGLALAAPQHRAIIFIGALSRQIDMRRRGVKALRDRRSIEATA